MVLQPTSSSGEEEKQQELTAATLPVPRSQTLGTSCRRYSAEIESLESSHPLAGRSRSDQDRTIPSIDSQMYIRSDRSGVKSSDPSYTSSAPQSLSGSLLDDAGGAHRSSRSQDHGSSMAGSNGSHYSPVGSSLLSGISSLPGSLYSSTDGSLQFPEDHLPMNWFSLAWFRHSQG